MNQRPMIDVRRKTCEYNEPIKRTQGGERNRERQVGIVTVNCAGGTNAERILLVQRYDLEKASPGRKKVKGNTSSERGDS